jgi:uncharacterized protein
MSEAKVQVTRNEAQSRFETTVDGETAVAEYRERDGVMQLTHTVVPQALEGRGIAAALIGQALDHARGHGLKVEALCSYAASYMQRHPETQDLKA